MKIASEVHFTSLYLFLGSNFDFCVLLVYPPFSILKVNKILEADQKSSSAFG